MEISVELANVKWALERISEAHRQLEDLKQRWRGLEDDDKHALLLFACNDLDNALREVESWQEDYWLDVEAGKEKLERWVAWAKGEE